MEKLFAALLVVFLFQNVVFSQKTWSLKMGAASGFIGTDRLSWRAISPKEFGFDYDNPLLLSPFIHAECVIEKTKNLSIGLKMGIYWQRFEADYRFGGLGYGDFVGNRWNSINLQFIPILLVKPIKWFAIEANFQFSRRLFDFSKLTSSTSGPYSTPPTAKNGRKYSNPAIYSLALGYRFMLPRFSIGLLAGFSLNTIVDGDRYNSHERQNIVFRQLEIGLPLSKKKK